MAQSFWRNPRLYLRSSNCQNNANFAQSAKKVNRRATECLSIDAKLVSYHSYQKMQLQSLRVKGTLWQALWAGWGLPDGGWQSDASPGEHHDRPGCLKSSAARGKLPSSYCQAWTKQRLMWVGSMLNPQSSNWMGRKGGVVFWSWLPRKAQISNKQAHAYQQWSWISRNLPNCIFCPCWTRFSSFPWVLVPTSHCWLHVTPRSSVEGLNSILTKLFLIWYSHSTRFYFISLVLFEK